MLPMHDQSNSYLTSYDNRTQTDILKIAVMNTSHSSDFNAKEKDRNPLK